MNNARLSTRTPRLPWHEIEPPLPRRNACHALDRNLEAWAAESAELLPDRHARVTDYRYAVYQEPLLSGALSYYYTFRHRRLTYHAGGFKTAEAAARAYDRCCIALGIRLKKLNFPGEYDL